MPEWGERREAVECSLGESFRNWISFTSLEWAGTEPLQDSGVAGDTRTLQVSEKYSMMHLSVVCSKVRVLKSFPKKILGENIPREDLFFFIFCGSVYKYPYVQSQFRHHSVYLVLSNKA